MGKEKHTLTIYGLKEEKRIGSHFNTDHWRYNEHEHLVLCNADGYEWAIFKDWTYFTVAPEDQPRKSNSSKSTSLRRKN